MAKKKMFFTFVVEQDTNTSGYHARCISGAETREVDVGLGWNPLQAVEHAAKILSNRYRYAPEEVLDEPATG